MGVSDEVTEAVTLGAVAVQAAGDGKVPPTRACPPICPSSQNTNAYYYFLGGLRRCECRGKPNEVLTNTVQTCNLDEAARDC